MKKVSIALLGCGTVGKGVIELLDMSGPLIEERLDTDITIERVMVRDMQKYEQREMLYDFLRTTEFDGIVNDED